MNIFISYAHESKPEADKIVELLENRGKKCWIAPRDVIVSYASDIIDAISHSEIFLLLLTRAAAESKHVLNEVECAYKYFKTNKCYILPIKLEDFELESEMEYYLQRIQFIDAYTRSLPDAVSELEGKIEKLFPASANRSASHAAPAFAAPSAFQTDANDDEVRIANRYYDTNDRYENRRLKTESELLFPIEKSVYDKLLAGRENQNCLIVSTMYAPGVMNRLLRPEIGKTIGLCYNEKACMAANYDYENEHVKFYCQDVEARDFEDNLTAYMDERGIDAFDVVDITMGFLDWKNPFKVIKIISHYARSGAKLFVRDIDDGVMFAYPDKNGLFRKFFSLYKLNPYDGYRKSGRRIYSYLKKLGCKDIIIERSGVDTTGMSTRDVEKMCFAYCGFIPNDFAIACRNEPNNQQYAAALEWLDEHYDDIEEEFMSDDFIFNSGYFIVSATFG